jgi:hypothetical protein
METHNVMEAVVLRGSIRQRLRARRPLYGGGLGTQIKLVAVQLGKANNNNCVPTEQHSANGALE